MAVFRISGYLSMSLNLEHTPGADPRDLEVHEQRARDIRFDHSVPGKLKRRFAGRGLTPLGSERYELEQAAQLYGEMAAWREAAGEEAQQAQEFRQRQAHLERMAAQTDEAGAGHITTATDALEEVEGSD
ncbi:hypothetical protein GCM10017783_04560 [Deinococcus piscis]|uniref:Uncharacterized protein n=2 Tax=Deinococcus piscis TaxID=394230 RepID=A0ABQ3K542_9DEIO|nr:hypothetical protein GCM10017783_04560 [Deinococcus piscis]